MLMPVYAPVDTKRSITDDFPISKMIASTDNVVCAHPDRRHTAYLTTSYNDGFTIRNSETSNSTLALKQH